MTDFQIILITVFFASMVVGFFFINNVPSLLHTPLMSGMNALSGITVVGALTATAIAIESPHSWMGYVFGSIAVICAMINVSGGFFVTHRMLRMFVHKKDKS